MWCTGHKSELDWHSCEVFGTYIMLDLFISWQKAIKAITKCIKIPNFLSKPLLNFVTLVLEVWRWRLFINGLNFAVHCFLSRVRKWRGEMTPAVLCVNLRCVPITPGNTRYPLLPTLIKIHFLAPPDHILPSF